MRQGSLLGLVLVFVACSSGGGGLGDPCQSQGDCGSSLQCLADVCVPRCQRAPECGDGYSCDQNGLCQVATGQDGDTCTAEVDCSAGLACELSTDPAGALSASCHEDNSGAPPGATCAKDDQCRHGTCALGRCVDLCVEDRDCIAGTGCTVIPRVDGANLANLVPSFSGCLQSHGSFAWDIPISGPSDTVLLPIPNSARSVAVTFSVEDATQTVGATQVTEPLPSTQIVVGAPGQTYFTDLVRHQSALGQSVLMMPSSPSTPLVPGAYRILVESHRDTTAGTATPTATAVVKVDASVVLDLHFYFLNFDDHPCAAAYGGTLNAQVASTAAFFQNDFLGMLRSVFAHGGVALGTMTYDDLANHPDLDGLDTTNAAALLGLGTYPVGVNVFFVRTLSPVGIQTFGPNPGPAGLATTPGSGIVVGLDSLCYRTWTQVARLASHELARYMGLYNNVEVGFDQDMSQQDPISDSDTSSQNLMFYSELGGTDLSAGQRDILSRSAVLR